ncbi:hypothetical protein FVE85_5380 [Porphyridium purpureum]|uniref:Glycosyltransferase family 92 protein n=1 Tax=Porphyridium purpureum TaxID=35688 RepID=A0A5J4Z3C5_PORPP|nr:hypothetical protein FVE85_5380 [Porphyridium purpureum]|eukprot:POR2745..scf295_1
MNNWISSEQGRLLVLSVTLVLVTLAVITTDALKGLARVDRTAFIVVPVPQKNRLEQERGAFSTAPAQPISKSDEYASFPLPTSWPELEESVAPRSSTSSPSERAGACSSDGGDAVNGPSSDEASPASIQVWYPTAKRCVGTFLLPENSESFGLDHHVMWIREAYIDRRFATQEFKPTPSHTRIVLHVTSHASATMSTETTSARLYDTALSEFVQGIHVESVFSLSHLIAPLTVTRDHDWVVHLMMDPALSSGWDQLMIELKLSGSYAEDSGVGEHIFSYTARFAVGCAADWFAPDIIPPVLNSRGFNTCADATGAAVVTSGGLFGAKLDSGVEAAHYAVRSLLGLAQFDVVGISVRVPHSVSEIEAWCTRANSRPEDGNTKCREGLHKRNVLALSRLKCRIETELTRLGVPSTVFARIVLFPYCRLGTSHKGGEAYGRACELSLYHGQTVALELAYHLFSPHFAWVASADVDEFFAPSYPWSKHVPEAASELFDRIRTHLTDGLYIFPWLNVFDSERNYARVTDSLLHASLPALVDPETQLTNESCYEVNPRPDRRHGKVVAHCKLCGAITVHKLFAVRPNATQAWHLREKGLSFQPKWMTPRFDSILGWRTWHVRSSVRRGFERHCELSNNSQLTDTDDHD